MRCRCLLKVSVLLLLSANSGIKNKTMNKVIIIDKNNHPSATSISRPADHTYYILCVFGKISYIMLS